MVEGGPTDRSPFGWVILGVLYGAWIGHVGGMLFCLKIGHVSDYPRPTVRLISTLVAALIGGAVATDREAGYIRRQRWLARMYPHPPPQRPRGVSGLVRAGMILIVLVALYYFLVSVYGFSD